MRYPCSRCGEQRCRTHCKCGREGAVTGRHAGRGRARSEGAAPRVIAAVQQPSVPRPVGAPSQLAVHVLSTADWYRQMLEGMHMAREVIVASYMFDHGAVHAELLKRLQGRGAFELQVLVDREAFLERTARRQRPRLELLRRAAGDVYLCRGTPPLGRFHMKAVIIDRRTVFTGSANITEKSQENTELTLRMTGPPAMDILRDVEAARLRGQLWGGHE